jgi:hypothetical protein
MDDATDSGYGGSIIDGASTDSKNLFEQSFSNVAQYRHQIPTDRQQEIYQENCRLLTGSIEDTKYILEVVFSFGSDLIIELEVVQRDEMAFGLSSPDSIKS